MSETIRVGLDLVKEAVQVRAEITEQYARYAELSKIVQAVALVEHADFKSAVDALYYLGGGWPAENSKGRMEKALDSFAGMYKLLSLIGKGNLVQDHLSQKGIHIQLNNPIQNAELSPADVQLLNKEFGMSAFGFEPKTTAKLVSIAIDAAQDLQRSICAGADRIKLELKPEAKDTLQIEDEEFNRLFFIQKFNQKPEKVLKKKQAISTSVTKFKEASKS